MPKFISLLCADNQIHHFNVHYIVGFFTINGQTRIDFHDSADIYTKLTSEQVLQLINAA